VLDRPAGAGPRARLPPRKPERPLRRRPYDDGVGLLFEDRALVRIVSARPDGRAYRVAAGADAQVDERVLEPELLDGAALGARRSVPTDIREYRAERYGRR
jgi:hypothetical protein